MLNAMVTEKVKFRRKNIGYRNWWDRSCTRKKKEVCRTYRKWRKERVEENIWKGRKN